MVAVIVAIVLGVLVLLSVLVVDVGYWYNVRRQLQAAADGAALAGCHELILDKSDTEIWSTVVEYVGHNTVTPANGAISVLSPSPGGLSDIGDDYVQVTVERPSESFFAKVLGVGSTTIRAQARAQVAYVTEGKGLVPFSVPIVLAGPQTGVEVRIGGDVSQLAPVDDETYAGPATLGASPAADEAISLPVDIFIYNSHGVLAESIENAARAIVRGSDFPITDVHWLDDWVAPGTSTSLRVQTFPGAPKPSVSIKGPGVNINNAQVVDEGGGSWRVDFTVPSGIVERYAVYEAEVSVRDGGDRWEFEGREPAATLVCRRSNAPVAFADFTDLVFEGAGTRYTDVTVDLTRFEISYDESGPEYALKVDSGGGAETGNFSCVDFRTIVAPPWPPYDNERDYDHGLISGDWYRYSLTNGWVGDIYIGDALLTYTGNTAGSTQHGLEDRFGGDSMSFGEWQAAGKPASGRVLYVPIVEKMEEQGNGRYWVAVVGFGAFYVEAYDKADQLVTGHFIEYIGASGGSTTDPGGSGLYLKTPHLVSTGITF